MKTKSLCDIFGIEPKPTEYELVVCKNPQELYNESKKLLKGNKITEYIEYKDSVLEITRVDSYGQEVRTRFTDSNNPESVRGMYLHRVYIEEDVTDAYLENSILRPALVQTGGKIIKKA